MSDSYLRSLARFGVQLGLERMAALLACLGQPQAGIPVVHVAGTNGKGSVCLLVSELLAAAGYRVGRYVSPHLVSWRERIWVSGQYIAAAEWEQVLATVNSVADYPGDLEPPTQFEVVTAAAWLYFRQQAVDIVVLEVGLGGRLDATNVGIEPSVSVITAIGMDHWQRLGNSLSAIATEKAGIIRATVPVVSIAQSPDCMQAIAAALSDAQQLHLAAPARRLNPEQVVWQGRVYPFTWPGEVALLNLGIALTTLEYLQAWPVSETAIAQALVTARWPGRCHRTTWQGKSILLDGAHNLPGAIALRQFADQAWPNQSITWLLGMLSTKDSAGVCQALLRAGDRLVCLPIADHQALAPLSLAEAASAVQPELASVTTLETLGELNLMLPTLSDPCIIAGSLYLLGQVMQTCLGWHEPEDFDYSGCDRHQTPSGK